MRRLSIIIAAVMLGLLAAAGFGLHATPEAARAQSGPLVLGVGCNNVALTWPDGTPASDVAAAVDPPENLAAIWEYQTARQAFVGYAPAAPQASDLQTVGMLDAAFLCMTGDGVLMRPALGAAPAAPSPTRAPAAARTTCADFPTQAAAQAAFDADPVGLANLDADHDGIACEALPGGASTAPAPAPAPQPAPAPTPAPAGPPPGATALCNDGTYTSPQHRRGACSGHGGVNRFLVPLPA